MRLSKFLAHSGYCSRREAEQLIQKNKVIINPSLNQITQCAFSVGFSKLEAKIKRPLSK